MVHREGGGLTLVEGEQLVALMRAGHVTSATLVYEVGPEPRPLGQIPELEHLLFGPIPSGPPVRRDLRSPERDFEEPVQTRPRRWPRRLAVVLALAAFAIVGYPRIAPHVATWRSLAVARLQGPPSPSPTAAASPADVPAAEAPPAVGTPSNPQPSGR